MTQNVQPIFILPEGTQRTTGRTAQRNNIAAAKLVAESVRSTLGPKGMDKMIVDSLGDVIITNDGVTILQEMNIEHPAAKMIVEVAKTQEDEVGDGTTTAVVIAGELLKQAEPLLEQNVHPSLLARGYRLAAMKAQKILETLGEDVSIKDTTVLKNIAITAMTGKGAEVAKDSLAEVVVEAVKSVLDETENGVQIDSSNIKIEKKVGGGVDDTELIKGVVLDKERVHNRMPRVVNKAKIALVDSAIEIKSTETDAKIQITAPSQMQSFLDQEEKMLKEMVNKIVHSGANVLFCQKGVDDVAQHFFANHGVFVARRVKKSDMENLSRATGAQVVTSIDELNEECLGYSGVVEEIKVGDEEMTFVRECKNPKAVTILVRGGTEHVTDEIKRAIDDAVGDVVVSLKVGKVVAGAGSIEMEVSKALKRYATSVGGKEQLAIEAFADAVEIIPQTLAESAGLDPIDKMAELRSAHAKGQKWAGIDVFSGKVKDAWKMNVIEPLKIKTQALKSGSEVAVMILRIDDIIAGSKGGAGAMPPPDMGGMGMPPM